MVQCEFVGVRGGGPQSGDMELGPPAPSGQNFSKLSKIWDTPNDVLWSARAADAKKRSYFGAFPPENTPKVIFFGACGGQKKFPNYVIWAPPDSSLADLPKTRGGLLSPYPLITSQHSCISASSEQFKIQ